MALKLEYINVIVPVARIRDTFGDDDYVRRFAVSTATTWSDGRLYREGCMNPYDLEEILTEWKERGLTVSVTRDGQTHWQDLCVVNSGQGPSFPCEWLAYDRQTNTAWLKGYPPGVAVGPADRKIGQ
jgi:hypothetical protein